MMIDQMMSELSMERSRVQAELQKLDKAISALEELHDTQQQRGIREAAAATANIVGMQAG